MKQDKGFSISLAFYALIAGLVPNKLVAMAIVYHTRRLQLSNKAPVYELFDKLTPEDLGEL